MSAVDRSLRNYRLVRLSTGLDYRFVCGVWRDHDFCRKELLSTWDRIPPSYILTTETTKSADEVHGIISALSVNHRQLFSLIARIQLEECRRKGRFDGIDKYGLLRDHRAVTICNTENKLDALLTEFVTHNVGVYVYGMLTFFSAGRAVAWPGRQVLFDDSLPPVGCFCEHYQCFQGGVGAVCGSVGLRYLGGCLRPVACFIQS